MGVCFGLISLCNFIYYLMSSGLHKSVISTNLLHLSEMQELQPTDAIFSGGLKARSYEDVCNHKPFA